MPEKKLPVLYQQMYELTNPKCGSCRAPNTCCDKMYCEATIAYANQEWNVELSSTGHPKLPLMGPKGCVAAPHLRPLCTVHVCEQHLMDVEFSEKYFDLRDQLNEQEELWLTQKWAKRPR